jgi:hypothetical protein
LRRRKAQQKRRNEAMRERSSDDESEPEVNMEISKEDRQEMERVMKLQRACTKSLVAFSPVEW